MMSFDPNQQHPLGIGSQGTTKVCFEFPGVTLQKIAEMLMGGQVSNQGNRFYETLDREMKSLEGVKEPIEMPDGRQPPTSATQYPTPPQVVVQQQQGNDNQAFSTESPNPESQTSTPNGPTPFFETKNGKITIAVIIIVIILILGGIIGYAIYKMKQNTDQPKPGAQTIKSSGLLMGQAQGQIQGQNQDQKGQKSVWEKFLDWIEPILYSPGTLKAAKTIQNSNSSLQRIKMGPLAPNGNGNSGNSGNSSIIQGENLNALNSTFSNSSDLQKNWELVNGRFVDKSATTSDTENSTNSTNSTNSSNSSNTTITSNTSIPSNAAISAGPSEISSTSSSTSTTTTTNNSCNTPILDPTIMAPPYAEDVIRDGQGPYISSYSNAISRDLVPKPEKLQPLDPSNPTTCLQQQQRMVYEMQSKMNPASVPLSDIETGPFVLPRRSQNSVFPFSNSVDPKSANTKPEPRANISNAAMDIVF